MEEDFGGVVRQEAFGQGGGENVQDCNEAWDDVRDGDSGSDGEAGEEDGWGGRWMGV